MNGTSYGVALALSASPFNRFISSFPLSQKNIKKSSIHENSKVKPGENMLCPEIAPYSIAP